MSKGNTFENEFLKLVFNGGTVTSLAQNLASSPNTFLYVSLHTADPGEGGNQTTSESAYGSYARKAIARTTGGWTVTAASVSPASNIDFVEATSGTETITHFAVGTTISGAGYLLYSGTVTPNITVSTGVTPRLTTSSTVTED